MASPSIASLFQQAIIVVDKLPGQRFAYCRQSFFPAARTVSLFSIPRISHDATFPAPPALPSSNAGISRLLKPVFFCVHYAVPTWFLVLINSVPYFLSGRPVRAFRRFSFRPIICIFPSYYLKLDGGESAVYSRVVPKGYGCRKSLEGESS